MKATRRDFLKKGGCALGMVSMATQMQHFGAMSAMAQKVIDHGTGPEGGSDYKALVCLFWSGGNDGNNMIIPIHNDGTISNYSVYSGLRGNLSVLDTAALPVSAPNIFPGDPTGNHYGFHPNLGTLATGGINGGIHPLYAAGDLAVICNVGTLARPMTRAQYLNNSVMKPYQLFSHSDQVDQAQSSVSSSATFTGWGGRLADKLNVGNNPNGLIPMVTSIAGAQIYTTGQNTLPLAIAQANTGATNNLTSILVPSGLPNTSTNAIVNARKSAFTSLRGQDLSSNYVAAASNVMNTAMSANQALQSAQEVTTAFPTTGIGRQLKQVARMIKSRDNLNINRQVFYVQIGGFDTHTDQVVNQATLFGQFSQAVRAFWDEMGAQTFVGGGTMKDRVTLFTLSDFGRTMNPASLGNPDVGSDHAWGNHMFVLGGAVNGGNFYGSYRKDSDLGDPIARGNLYPTLVLGATDDSDNGTGSRGRWLPTTSVDQYAVRLARWFGLAPGDEAAVFPNLQYFTPYDGNTVLNFMQ